MTGHESGRVVVSYGPVSIVEPEAGGLLRCLSRRRSGRTVCGDFVCFHRTSPDEGVIDRILPRRNTLSRTNYRGEERALAANIDLLAIVLAPEPAPDFVLLDRYLVIAEHLGAQAVIVLNKCDLQAATDAPLRQRLEDYAALSYPLVWTSTVTGEGLTELQSLLADGTGILVGQSGVGKSSLINRLLPDRVARTQALSAASGQGRHTTTETTLYPLPGGGALIDSPGIRILRLAHLDAEAIARGFRELCSLQERCQFRNCRHRDEPGCAVRPAVADGQIAASRLASFHLLLDEARA